MAYLSLGIFRTATLWKQSPHTALGAQWTLPELADDGGRERRKPPWSRIIYVIMLQPLFMWSCYNHYLCDHVTTIIYVIMLQQLFMWSCYNHYLCDHVTTIIYVIMLQPLFMWSCYCPYLCDRVTTIIYVIMLQPLFTWSCYNHSHIQSTNFKL